MEVLKTLKDINKLGYFLGIAIILFLINNTITLSLPGSIDNMCTAHGFLTIQSVSYSILISILTSLLIVNIARAQQEKKKDQKIKGGIATGIGGSILSFFGIYCAACALPAISILGISFSMNFLIKAEPIIKIASIILIVLGLYLIEKQHRKICKMCIT